MVPTQSKITPGYGQTSRPAAEMDIVRPFRVRYTRGDCMAKKGMARPERTHTQPRNDAPAVPEIQGKAKHGKEPANPIVAGTHAPQMKVYHERKGSGSNKGSRS